MSRRGDAPAKLALGPRHRSAQGHLSKAAYPAAIRPMPCNAEAGPATPGRCLPGSDRAGRTVGPRRAAGARPSRWQHWPRQRPRCRGGRPWRAASVFAEIGWPAACIATSITAATARTPLRGSRGMQERNAVRGESVRPSGNILQLLRGLVADVLVAAVDDVRRHSCGTKAACVTFGRV